MPSLPSKTIARRQAYVLGCVALCVALLLSSSVRAFVPTIDQAASSVIGQSSFTTSGTGSGLAQLYFTEGAVVDPTTGKLFVADYRNNRVLRFSAASILTDGPTAEATFGGTQGCTATTMYLPAGVYIDATGTLWVADLYNDRVLMFLGASTAASGSAATLVIGQPSFTVCTAGTTQATLNQPTGVTGDTAGNIWISDSANSRVLLFAHAASGSAAGQAATSVLGQSNFTSSARTASQTGLNIPWQISLDASGTLWVADANDCRILGFDDAASLANGAPASVVLGQPNFLTVGNAATASAMSYPYGVGTDSSGNLFVADSYNQRVLVFTPPFSNGMSAISVLGQPGFTTNTMGVSATAMTYPSSIAFSPSGALLVADTNNSRVLGFVADSCTVTPPVNAFLGNCPSVLASGATCQLSCASGYTISGASTSCTNGALTAQTCTPSSCSVSAPTNGTLGGCPGVLSSGSSCQVACNSGFTVTGTTTQCSYGQLIVQTCAPSACVVSAPLNGTLGACAASLSSGSSCQLACNGGYTLTGASTSCTDGVLTAQTCAPSTCTVTAPANGTLGACPSSLASGASCQVSCNAGFTVTGTATSCTDGVLVSTQTCAPASCALSAPPNGTLGNCPSVLPSGTSCQMACNAGYSSIGTSTTCTDGSFISQACAPNSCSVGAPENGTPGNCPSSLSSGATCQLSCNAGYTIMGGSTSCTNGGLFSQTCAVTAAPAPAMGFWGTLWLAAILGALGAYLANRSLRDQP